MKIRFQRGAIYPRRRFFLDLAGGGGGSVPAWTATIFLGLWHYWGFRLWRVCRSDFRLAVLRCGIMEIVATLQTQRRGRNDARLRDWLASDRHQCAPGPQDHPAIS